MMLFLKSCALVGPVLPATSPLGVRHVDEPAVHDPALKGHRWRKQEIVRRTERVDAFLHGVHARLQKAQCRQDWLKPRWALSHHGGCANSTDDQSQGQGDATTETGGGPTHGARSFQF
jgi:hypothetical protein